MTRILVHKPGCGFFCFPQNVGDRSFPTKQPFLYDIRSAEK
nr:MAG TPA: hypothetical protein [Bacteriophage sp.]